MDTANTPTTKAKEEANEPSVHSDTPDSLHKRPFFVWFSFSLLGWQSFLFTVTPPQYDITGPIHLQTPLRFEPIFYDPE